MPSSAELIDIAFIVEPAATMRILEHLGEPIRPPRAAPIRDPPWIASPRQWSRVHSPVPETSFDAMPDYVRPRRRRLRRETRDEGKLYGGIWVEGRERSRRG